MSEPLVSICIGAYNRKDYIRECLDSALGQTWREKEIIVVDDASTDGTLQILETYGDAIRLIRRETNSGICPVTRNQASNLAQGRYIAYLDSDDVWRPHKLEKQVEFMETHPEIPLCHTSCGVIDATSRHCGVRHPVSVMPPTGMIFKRLLEHCWITISTVMLRKSLFEEIGAFACGAPYGYLGEDHEYFLRVARKYPIGFIPEILADYRKGGQGITAKNWKASPEPVPLMQALLGRNDIWEGIVGRQDMVDALCRMCDSNVWFYRDRGENRRALWFIFQMLKVSPLKACVWRHFAGLVRRR